MLVPSAKIFYRITLGHKIIWVINSGIQNFYSFDIFSHIVPFAKVFYRVTFGHKSNWVINLGIQNCHSINIFCHIPCNKKHFENGKETLSSRGKQTHQKNN